VEAATRRIVFEDGSKPLRPADLGPPHEAPKVVRDAGLVNASGWIPVEPQTLEVKSANAPGRVYAAGDVTVVPLPGRYKPDMPLSLPKAGVFAHAHGEVIAHQIAAQLTGATPDASWRRRLPRNRRQARSRADATFSAAPVMRKQPPDEHSSATSSTVARQLKPVAATRSSASRHPELLHYEHLKLLVLKHPSSRARSHHPAESARGRRPGRWSPNSKRQLGSERAQQLARLRVVAVLLHVHREARAEVEKSCRA
jgi:hypothetical protein